MHTHATAGHLHVRVAAEHPQHREQLIRPVQCSEQQPCALPPRLAEWVGHARLAQRLEYARPRRLCLLRRHHRIQQGIVPPPHRAAAAAVIVAAAPFRRAASARRALLELAKDSRKPRRVRRAEAVCHERRSRRFQHEEPKLLPHVDHAVGRACDVALQPLQHLVDAAHELAVRPAHRRG